jgi:hypothetical protein
VGLALRIRDLDEETLASFSVKTKLCSACDPDVPGHVERKLCQVCHGTGKEGLSFQGTFSEITTSKMERVRGPRKMGELEYDGDGDDEIQDLEY